MNIFIDIETLRSPEEHRLQILSDIKENFKAPSTLTKAQAAIDLGLTDAKEIKFTSKDDMIARWEKELAPTKSEDVAQGQWEKTSFNPDVALIACICIGWFDDHGYRQAVFESAVMHNEKEMLEEFHSYITSLCTSNGTEVRKVNFVGHNLAKFDLPFIWKRSVINDVPCCAGVKWNDAKHGYSCYDTMIAWAGFGNRISADNLCNILGIKGKTEGMDGSLVYDTWQTDPHKVIEYCHDDVTLVKEIHARLTK
jgi:predicted PolB exonuclease-like 3'-5' exonuclease